MDTVRSWLDADEVRRMAEGLMSPQVPKEPAQSNTKNVDTIEDIIEDTIENECEDVTAEGGEPLESDTNSLPLPSVSKALASARKVAEGSGMLHVSSSGPSPSVPTDDTRSDQVESEDDYEIDPMLFIELSEKWTKQFGLRAMVVIASDAEVIFDTLGNSKLTQMAQKLAKAAPSAGHLFVRIGAGSSLQVIPVPTENGKLIFGILVSSALSSDQVKLLSDQVV